MDNKTNIVPKAEGNERHISSGERALSFRTEAEPKKEKEITPDEKIVREEIMREIEMMEEDDSLKAEAEQKVKKIHFLSDDKKLEELVKIAREQGVIAAVKMAKSMNDPFLLDTLHDILSKEGYYKNFVK
jgi:DNA-binding transcriptional regulator GbsR (MarR family)